MEDFDSDVHLILNNLQIANEKIPKINPSHRTPDYRAYYNDVSRNLIESFFSEDKLGIKALLGFFVGEVMLRSRGVADPKETTSILKKLLN